MGKTTTLPETLYIKSDGAKDEAMFFASPVLVNLAELGQTTRIGVYRLTQMIDAEGVVNRRPVPRQRC